MSVLAAVKEMFAESRADFERRNAEYAQREAEHAQRNAEYAQRNAEQAQRNAEYNQQVKESRDDFERQLKKSRDDFDRQLKESRDDFDRRMKKLTEQMGGLSNSHGLFAEEYFINSFEDGNQSFFGEHFDRLESNVKGIKEKHKDEYDILLINGQSVGIVEVKFKARDKDVPKVINKAKTFRINFPDYQHHQIYLGFAALVFAEQVEQECIENGIAVIKQIGDAVVINDEHLRVF